MPQRLMDSSSGYYRSKPIVMNKAVIVLSVLLVFIYSPTRSWGGTFAGHLTVIDLSDTTEIRKLYDLAIGYYNTDEPDSSKKYANLAVELADQGIFEVNYQHRDYLLKCRFLKAQSLHLLGNILLLENEQAALDRFEAALTLMETIGDTVGMASTHSSLGSIYSDRTDYRTALIHYYAALNFYLQSGDRYHAGMSYYYIGLNQRYMGIYGDAFESNLKSLEIGREIRDTQIITNALLSNGFLFIEDSSDALKYQQEALDIFMQQNDSAGIAIVYNDRAVVYWLNGDLEKALVNHQKALSIREKLQDYGYISISHNYIADVLQEQGNLPLALTHIFEALKYSEMDGGSFEIEAYLKAGQIYLQLDDFQNALKYYHSAAKISEKGNINGRQAEALEGMAEVFLEQGKNQEAIKWLRKAEEVVAPDNYWVQSYIYRALSEAYARNNDYRNAFESQIKYKVVSDSVFRREQTEKITSLSKQLEFENIQALQKASQESQLSAHRSEIERQKLVRNFSMAGLFFVIILAVIYFIRFKEKGKLNIALQSTISHLKATQSQLVQSEKLASLGELTAGIAHEIQNPLNFVNNFSALNSELVEELKEAIYNQDQAEIKIIMDNLAANEEKVMYHGKRAENIVKSMLQHSRASSRDKELTDINLLCEEYLRLAYHGLRARDKSFNADFQSDLDSSIPQINVVPQDISRVLLNLINNAFQACAERRDGRNITQAPVNTVSLSGAPPKWDTEYRPLVIVSTKKLENCIEIRVCDNGRGIPDHIKDKIFQPFFTTKSPGQGTGLGLSLSHDIIKAHGGTIKVNSEEGVGTEFCIDLPME